MQRRTTSGDEARRQRAKEGITAGLAVLIVLAAVAIYFFVTATPDEQDAPPPATLMDSTACERLVQVELREGLIRSRPSPTLIEVDESHWTALAAEQRRSLLDQVACAAFSGRTLDQLQPGETIEVRGSASGAVIAMAGVDGIVAR